MAGEATAPPDVGLRVDQLDILELVRTGALTAFPRDGGPGSLCLELGRSTGAVGEAEEVQLTDLEGVPVARVPAVVDSGRLLAQGVPTWLSARSTRPFEAWHRGPDAVGRPTGVVVLRGPAPREHVTRVLQQAGARPLLLLLISLDGDVDPAALDTARVARDLLTVLPDAAAAIAPTPRCLAQADRDAVVDAYSHGRPVWFVEPEDVAATTAGGTVLFFTGLSGAGKSTLAREVRNRLVETGRRVTLLDGDVVRRHLSAGLGFSADDRARNVRRIGWVAAEIAAHGGTAICSPIAPSEQVRQEVRQMVESRGGRFLLVHVATPLAECERRDRKGLYARARRGEVSDFTGISAPYEAPSSPELRVDTTGRDLGELVDDVLALMDGGVRC